MRNINICLCVCVHRCMYVYIILEIYSLLYMFLIKLIDTIAYYTFFIYLISCFYDKRLVTL